jgi:hypothetical protein
MAASVPARGGGRATRRGEGGSLLGGIATVTAAGPAARNLAAGGRTVKTQPASAAAGRFPTCW